MYMYMYILTGCSVPQIVERVEYVSNHWYKGRIGDKEGVFPDNFVKTIYGMFREKNTTAHKSRVLKGTRKVKLI